MNTQKKAYGRIGEIDLHLFNEGTHTRLYEKLGAHVELRDGQPGVSFAVWAPDAEAVSVFGDFSDWKNDRYPLNRIESSGIWEGFVPGAKLGQTYKYHVASRYMGYKVDKADPFAFYAEVPPKTASVIWEDDYQWNDEPWMSRRRHSDALGEPMSIYEVHLGSWRRSPESPTTLLSYRELAPLLVDYVTDMGFTHVEFMPLTEHPFYLSWGYQTTGYFAPTSRYGDPAGLKYLIDQLHQAGISVILDWVPSHFPTDEHGLNYFDGTHVFEHMDPRLGHHPDWKSSIFNYGRNEVRAFLLSSACFWLENFHIDALRVDAVASMLYLDYSREEGEWIPNEFGGRENLAAMSFLRELNRVVFGRFPGAQTMAEESTAWPMVSRPVEVGGLGFGMKWDMGWMHDTLAYMAKEPVHRRYHQDWLTFRSIYQNSENFVLPLSHDEVVHGKGSLINKMPGDEWQRFANLRSLYAYMYAQTGKKLIFMGGEFAQSREWNVSHSLDWHLLQYDCHRGIQRLVRDLNQLHKSIPALHQGDCRADGFSWVDCNDRDQSVISLLRYGRERAEPVLVVCNFTPVVRHAYRVGVPRGGRWKELLNTDSEVYWGSGVSNGGGVEAKATRHHGLDHALDLTLPPLGVVYLMPES